MPPNDDSLEIILNLWYIYDDTGMCFGLRARAYIATGTEREKLDLLHLLAGSDWRSATVYPIPKQFCVVRPDGVILEGLFDLRAAGAIGGMITLFEPAIRQIQAELPRDCRLTIPNDPLTCLTPLYMNDDSSMEARVTTPHRASKNFVRAGFM